MSEIAGPLTIGSMLHAAERRQAQTDAIVFSHRRLSFAELAERVSETAGGLLGLGVERGDVVGILMPNCVDHVVAMLAAAEIGAMCLPLNARYRARELSHVVADGTVKVLLTNDIADAHVDFASRLQEALPELAAAPVGETPALGAAPDLQHVILLGSRRAAGMESADVLVAAAETVDKEVRGRQAANVHPDDGAVLLYTSGTTAMPKGCALTHRRLIEISRMIALRLGTREGDRLWDALPMFHASSLLPLLGCIDRGATFISQVHFDAVEAVELIERESATLAWPAYTTIWQSILADPAFDPRRLATLRALLCVGPAETLESMESQLPTARLLSCYGITEGCGVPVMCSVEDPAEIRLRTCGTPFPGVECEIRDPQTGRSLDSGERGALWLRGRYVIDGYWNDAAATAEAFDADGWFATGDLVSSRPDGRLLFHGRLKETLKVGGENVAALEIEECLMCHPAVKLAAVVPLSDAKYGEVPGAFVELRPGHRADEEELIGYCRSSIASFKVPRYIREIEEWPMSATKIRKDVLQARLLEEVGPGPPA